MRSPAYLDRPARDPLVWPAQRGERRRIGPPKSAAADQSGDGQAQPAQATRWARTEKMGGRPETAADQVLPPSDEAYRSPDSAPKYRPRGSPPSWPNAWRRIVR